MENFFKLSECKQKQIIDASLSVFGRYSFKKASVMDIAKKAKISKSMVFYYFKNKKALYFYLIKFCEKLILDEFQKSLDLSALDFFDRIKHITKIKMVVMKRHPAILLFLKNVHYETDSEVQAELKEFASNKAELGESLLLSEDTATKFKDGVDPLFIYKMLAYIAGGLTNEIGDDNTFEAVDKFCEDFYKFLDLMKASFYK